MKQRYNGYVKIDLNKVTSEKIFADKGFSHTNPKAEFNIWAKKDQEVLIEKHIPQEAISKPNQ
jgi:hypothetical protein